MKAYVISDIEVFDAPEFDGYKTLSAQSIEKHGGTFLVRGGLIKHEEGAWTPNRLVVLEFPSLEVAERWLASDEYAPAREIRQRCAKADIVLVQGV